MADYAVSDLHGRTVCYEKIKRILEPGDRLFVLGDVLGRQYGGLALLLRMAAEGDVLLYGNHELEALSHLTRLYESEEYVYSPGFLAWRRRDLGVVYREFMHMSGRDKRCIVCELPCRMHSHLTVTANGRRCLLAHAGPQAGKIDSQDPQDWVYFRPKRGELPPRIGGMLLIAGHTPTGFMREEMAGKALFSDGYIGIDASAPREGEGNVGLLRLDDMTCRYVKG